MDFTVTRGDREDFYSGDATYRFDSKTGLLIVVDSDGMQRTYSQTGWDHLDQRAGQVTARVL